MKSLQEVDVIIVSYAENEVLRKMTEECLSSLLDSEDPESIGFNIIVVESNKLAAPYHFRNTRTIYPSCAFGYHRYLNIGIYATKAEYVCICNNDLIFHQLWATNLLKTLDSNSDLHSVSPFCNRHHLKHEIAINTGIHYGYEVGREVTGWCILFRRKILAITGPLDERFRFWYADNDYSNTLQMCGLKHALVTSSMVNHLESKTLNSRNKRKKSILTSGERLYYEYKWQNKPKAAYLRDLIKFYFQLIFSNNLQLLK